MLQPGFSGGIVRNGTKGTLQGYPAGGGVAWAELSVADSLTRILCSMRAVLLTSL